MNYNDTWWMSMYISLLTTYLLATNIVTPAAHPTVSGCLSDTARHGCTVGQEGRSSYLEDKSPESTGDARAG